MKFGVQYSAKWREVSEQDGGYSWHIFRNYSVYWFLIKVAR